MGKKEKQVQKVHWILTLPQNEYTPYKPECVRYIRGQLELPERSQLVGGDVGETQCEDNSQGGSRGGAGDARLEQPGGFLHWQVFVSFKRSVRLSFVRNVFGERGHYEPTRSKAAKDYCWKEDTYVDGTRFELGRPDSGGVGSTTIDWEHVWRSAIDGRFEQIPASVRVRSYRSLRQIQNDNDVPKERVPTIRCYWGDSGSGKTRRAYEEAGRDVYFKDQTQWWDGYKGESRVIIDDFDGEHVGITFVLRWLDRYPVRVQIKGGYVAAAYDEVWVTSNLHPKDWYIKAPVKQQEALVRRFHIIEEIKNA